MKGIEFVCVGNNGRSVMAEVVTKAHARKIGADIPIYSSGTMVKQFFEVGPKPRAIAALNALGINDKPTELTKKFIELESKFRNEALKIRGYPAVENHTQKHIDLQREVDIYLTMDEYVKQDFSRLPATKPKIYTIAEYSNVEIPHVPLQGWLSDVNVHLMYLDAIIKATPNVIDKYLCEFNK